MSTRKRLCPQCKIHRFRVKNDSGESVVVIVTEDFEVVPIHPEESLEGFDLTVLYCLGCSWKGSPGAAVMH
ncbi:MAG: hypothetical protein RBT57_01070 [Paludibacter sp.]|jgi:hypothetical protein|nr:hypothetical protein [Paludibacter sp.]